MSNTVKLFAEALQLSLETGLSPSDAMEVLYAQKKAALINQAKTEGSKAAPTESGEKVQKPLSRQMFQEAEILRVIHEKGYSPQALPVQKRGTKGVKSEVRDSLKYTPSVFVKAWERLRANGDIKDAE